MRYLSHPPVYILLSILSSSALEATTSTPVSPTKQPQNLIPLFSTQDCGRIVEFWNQPERYISAPVFNTHKEGLLQVRLTPEGSLWLWNYKAAKGAKGSPQQSSKSENGEEKEWEDWIDAKIAYDQWQAQQVIIVCSAPIKPPITSTIICPSPHPGPIPKSLETLVGNPPPFAKVVMPFKYKIQYDGGPVFEYNDHVHVRIPRYPYYRFYEGIISPGPSLKKIPASERRELFQQASITESEQRVMEAVSLLEGGFETINTYDTGYVSFGLMQFTTGREGNGNLAKLLLQYKLDHPENFQKNFHHYGIDVTPKGILVVIDPSTGVELTGSNAVMKIIEDKRLPSIFQRAGKESREFKIAQLKAAKRLYYPADQMLTFSIDGKIHKFKVSDIIRSEAGMATVMDRKVNTGKLNLLSDVLANLIKKHSLDSSKSLSKHEKTIIQTVKYRKDFTEDKTLTQPKN